MTLRRLLNLGYAHLTDGLDADDRKNMDTMLRMKFDHEMTKKEQKRAEAFRMAVQTGAIKGQKRMAGLLEGARSPRMGRP